MNRIVSLTYKIFDLPLRLDPLKTFFYLKTWQIYGLYITKVVNFSLENILHVKYFAKKKKKSK